MDNRDKCQRCGGQMKTENRAVYCSKCFWHKPKKQPVNRKPYPKHEIAERKCESCNNKFIATIKKKYCSTCLKERQKQQKYAYFLNLPAIRKAHH